MRAQKPKGSVVYNKSRGTWNFLWCEARKRKSRMLGTLAELPTHADAVKKAEQVKRELRLVAARKVPILRELIGRYRAEKMPKRYSTRRSYDVWLRLYIVPQWGERPILELQARPVELWLRSLDLAPRSKTGIRGMLRILWDYAEWRGDVPTQRNPMELVSIDGASKRTRKPHSMSVEVHPKPLMYIDSRGRLGLAINQASFAATYGIKPPVNLISRLRSEPFDLDLCAYRSLKAPVAMFV